MKLLITGSKGFIGRNLLESLQNKYTVFAPDRNELDLLNMECVEHYLKNNRFDVIIHTANINLMHHSDLSDYNALDGNLRMFYNLEHCKQYFGKMLYFGSGAEYDMRNYQPNMSEDCLGRYIPVDAYGFSKYIMAKTSEQSNNIYDLVLFGVYGKYEEWERRFISNNICNNLQGKPMTLSQNAYFDYLYIDDLVEILNYFIENKPKYKRYNICRGTRIDLLSLAQMINRVMYKDTEILVEKSGFKKEYTGSNDRMLRETKYHNFETFESTIGKMVSFYEG